MAKNTSSRTAASRKHAGGTRPQTKPERKKPGSAAQHGQVPSKTPTIPPRDLPGTSEEPTGPDVSWRLINDARRNVFDQAVPAYLLDRNYFFLDWNPAFDLLVAQPLGLRRIHSHAEDFVRSLKNVRDVFERSKRVFAPGNAPLLDLEPLVFESEPYGEIEFQKIAVQIADESAAPIAWSVFLNISRADCPKELWRDLHLCLQNELHWARYSVSYDKLLLKFDAYDELVTSIVARLSDCRRCLDLGAGTGNGTIKLLETRRDREVWAVELNHAMIAQLIEKTTRAEQAAKRDYFSRLRTFKDDVTGLDKHIAMPHDYFDGAIMVNVLYTLSDPEHCLCGVRKLLRPGGKLVLSTPHAGTDVDKLFAGMRESLIEVGAFQSMRSCYQDARQRHRDMIDLIHRDTKDAIRSYLENCGFRITAWQDSAYVDAVVIVEAVKD